MSHDLYGSTNVTVVLELSDRRSRDVRGEDGAYSSQDPVDPAIATPARLDL